MRFKSSANTISANSLVLGLSEHGLSVYGACATKGAKLYSFASLRNFATSLSEISLALPP